MDDLTFLSEVGAFLLVIILFGFAGRGLARFVRWLRERDSEHFDTW